MIRVVPEVIDFHGEMVEQEITRGNTQDQPVEGIQQDQIVVFLGKGGR